MLMHQVPNRLVTYVVIDGEEHMAEVFFESSPPEPDVGWAGGLDIERVFIRDMSTEGRVRNRMLGEKITYDVDVTDKVGDQFGRLLNEVGEHMSGWAEDDRY